MSYTVLHESNMESENTASITIRCDKQFKARLERYAKSKDLTVSQLVRSHFRETKPAGTNRRTRKRKEAA